MYRKNFWIWKENIHVPAEPYPSKRRSKSNPGKTKTVTSKRRQHFVVVVWFVLPLKERSPRKAKRIGCYVVVA